ncbi:MAG TPA: glucosyl-3-phosphoglycerate synthase [archaeon]|nr:glucosyl-3-phosphoglycerate synthase [archaeon]
MILMDVGEWFSKNKFHADDFSDIGMLVKLKNKKKKKISCVIPTLNEEKTVGKVISEVKRKLMETHRLVDEIIVVDSGSDDRTKKVAEKAGAQFFYSRDILKRFGGPKGKGENLWKSLFVASGDIISWIDADIENISAKFVYGLVGPLLQNEKTGFVKGFYKRPLGKGGKTISLEGGRVTELLMRPLYNLYFPNLSGFIQPLSGEYAGRREVLEQIPFFTSYAVEMGMLIDIERKFGLDAMAQVDLEERVHRNRPLQELSRMSFEILQAFSQKANALGVFTNIDRINQMYTLIQPGFIGKKSDYHLNINKVITLQRPPMTSVIEYVRKFHPEQEWLMPMARDE